MIRIVRTPEGLRVDPTGKLAGRGAYLHDRRSCWERGLRGALAHALKVELTDQDRQMLLAHMETLPGESEMTAAEPEAESENEESKSTPEMGSKAVSKAIGKAVTKAASKASRAA
jgi:predicted RNA-binding protein YlxR (DUF448 family)